MSFVVISLNHRHALLDAREKFAFSPEQIEQAYLTAVRHGLHNLIILSTCNRVELMTQSDCEGIRERLTALLAELKGIPMDRFQLALEYFQGDAALEHLIRVGSGMDSMVMGEPQIFGQVKQAYQQAKEAGMVNPKLDFMFQHAFNTIKEIRHHTSIGHCPVSVAYSSLKLMETAQVKAHPDILLLGAGDTAALVMRHLSGLSPQHVYILNRTYQHAEKLAHSSHGFEASVASRDELAQLCEHVDVIIGTTASEDPWITQACLSKTRTKPLLCIDLAVPRDISPCIEELPYVTLYSMDDIQTLIQKNTLHRTQAAVVANDMIERSILEFNKRKAFKDAERDLVIFRSRLHEIKEDVLVRAKQKLAAGQAPEEVLDAFARTLVNTLLHEPSSRLYHAESKSHQEKLVDSLRLLWGSCAKPGDSD